MFSRRVKFFLIVFIPFLSFADEKVIPVLKVNSGHPCSFEIQDEKLEENVKIKSIGATVDGIDHKLSLDSNLRADTDGNLLGTLTDGSFEALVKFTLGSDTLTISLTSKQTTVESWNIELDAQPDESFVGVAERPVQGSKIDSWRLPETTAGLDLRGEAVDLIVDGTLPLYVPFYLSSRGYSLFIRDSWPGRIDFAKSSSSSVSISWNSPTLEIKISLSRSPQELVERFTLESGPPVLLPAWAFKQWRWRDENSNLKTYFDGTPVTGPFNSQLMEDLLMSEALEIPLGVYWIDRPWSTGEHGYDSFEFDELRFPQSEQMRAWMQAKRIKLGTWIAPIVMAKGVQEAQQKNLLLPGRDTHSDFSALLDFTNPQSAPWWAEFGLKKLLKSGVNVLKLDRGDEFIAQDSDLKSFDGESLKHVRNDYPRQYASAVHNIASSELGQDFALLARAGYTGSSKYTAIWGGDISGNEQGLRSSIIAVQRAAVLGFPWWGSDTGGYSRGFDREVLARWYAFSTFSPIMEIGPLQDRAPWDLSFSKEPYDSEMVAIYAFYSQLREKLLPYLYKQVVTVKEKGTPIVRPLFMAFPEDKKALGEWGSYMFGESILVHPLWQKNQGKDEVVYLPAGHMWRDLWRPEKVYEGGRAMSRSFPLHQIPLFAEAGSGLVIGNLERWYSQVLDKTRHKPSLLELEKKAALNRLYLKMGDRVD